MKAKVIVFILAAVLSLSLISIPPAFSQADSTLKIVSYSWYTRPSDGYFIVVGEVQNRGNFIVKSVSLSGTVYSTEGVPVASSSIDAYGNYLLPETKAPFYMDFPPQSSITGDLSWNATVDRIEFSISNPLPAGNREYEYLNMTGIYSGILNDVYLISGFVYNSGNKTANDVRVVGTFYDNSARVVAVGFGELEEALQPNDAQGFSIVEFDATPSSVSQIANYSLLVQTSTLADTSGSPPTPNNGGETVESFPLTYIVAIAVVIIVAAVVIALFVHRRRKAALPKSPAETPPEEIKSSEYSI